MREELEFFGDLKKLWEFCGGVKFMVQKLLSEELVLDLESEGWRCEMELCWRNWRRW